MESHEIIESDSNQKSNQKKYLIRIAIFIAVNTILYTFLIKAFGSWTANFLLTLQANLISVNILGFILGLIVAIIPYKGLPFRRKYLRSSLLSILTIHIIMTIGLICIGIMTIMGLY